MIKLKQKAISSVHGDSDVKQLAIEFTLSFLKELLIERPLWALIREPASALEFILGTNEAEAEAAVRALIDAKVLEPIDAVTYQVNPRAFELVKSLEGVRELFIQEAGEEAGLEKLNFILEAIEFRQLQPTPLTLVAFGEAYMPPEPPFSKSPSFLNQAQVELQAPWLKHHLTAEAQKAVPERLELVVVLEAQQAALKPMEPFTFTHARSMELFKATLKKRKAKPVEPYISITHIPLMELLWAALKKRGIEFKPPATPQPSRAKSIRGVKAALEFKPPATPQPTRAKVRAVRAALEAAGVIINGYVNVKAFEPLASLEALKEFHTSLAERQAQDELKEKRKKVLSGFSEKFIEEAFEAIREKEYI